MLDSFREFLPWNWRPAPSPEVRLLYSLRVGGRTRAGARQFHLLYEGGVRVARTLDLDEALAALETRMHQQIAEASWRKMFVHAGVVGWQGRAIVLPGKTFTGKTSLVVELVRAGATYYSDEFAVIDERGWVHPYPRPLSIRSAGTDSPVRAGADELGGVTGRRPIAIGLIAFTRFRAESEWRARRITAGAATLTLLRNTFNSRSRPERALAALGAATRGARLLRGTRGEASEAAARLLREVEMGR